MQNEALKLLPRARIHSWERSSWPARTCQSARASRPAWRWSTPPWGAPWWSGTAGGRLRTARWAAPSPGTRAGGCGGSWGTGSCWKGGTWRCRSGENIKMKNVYFQTHLSFYIIEVLNRYQRFIHSVGGFKKPIYRYSNQAKCGVCK